MVGEVAGLASNPIEVRGGLGALANVNAGVIQHDDLSDSAFVTPVGRTVVKGVLRAG